MTVTFDLFEAYLKCPTKCFLWSRGEADTENVYANWVKTKSESYRREGFKRLMEGVPCDECVISPPDTGHLKTAKWRLTVDLVVRAQNLESSIHTVERISSDGRAQSAQFLPIRFIFTNKLSRDDKLLLAFDALVLSEMLSRKVGMGKIIHGDDQATLKVKASALAGEVRKLTGKIATLLSNPSPPDLVLNRHCVECEFQTRCRQKTIEKDDLSLLSGMTEKERKKFNSKGIFTVTQLSYTFRPRWRPKRLAAKREKYHHSLKALAIRERRIHIVGSPELKIEGTPVYLDVEGLPDRDFHYLIGVRVKTAGEVVQHSLWADSADEEKQIWSYFLEMLSGIDNPILIHYGRYETNFLKQMCERYGGPSEGSVAAKALAAPLNLLSVTYSCVYFPAHSNGLKDHAKFLSFEWSVPNASGALAVVWRFEWEKSRESRIKETLITYNADDCEALRLLTEFLCNLSTPTGGSSESDAPCAVNVESLSLPSQLKFRNVQFQLPEFDTINKSAYWDYQRERILVRSSERLKGIAEETSKPMGINPRANKTIVWPGPARCPKCNGKKFYKHRSSSKTVLDVQFGASGIKRWITKYLFYRYRCPKCGAVFHNSDRAWANNKFGVNLRALSVYENIDLQMPQERVAIFLNDVLGFDLPRSATNRLKASAAAFYEDTYERLVKTIASGNLVHADETKVNLKTGVGYVWAFTNLEDVAYVYAPSREGDLVHLLLKDFKGVLVSDFYSAYDSVDCPQQKCLIHLIRDLNDDLMKEPFNDEMKGLVGEFAVLLKAIIVTVDRFGLKARFLRAHKVSVDRFFKRLAYREYQTETALKCKTRLEKNRCGLFTFLDFDSVPWNNNNAEHAIKAFALLRRDFNGVATEKGIREYLILLSVCETCRCKGVSFLEFLRSGEKDIDAFAESKWKRARKATRCLSNSGDILLNSSGNSAIE
ncbi:MAG TPA: IS66 family transposase [Candidatus Wunengus sp. YC65]|uniref:IS66 family transposase n=1 Tax=Candidatus Wunengus sp. YC65 TaxID=3367701 RepID=UPI0040260118